VTKELPKWGTFMSTSAGAIGDDDLDEALGERYYRGHKDLEDQATADIIVSIHKAIERHFKEGGGPALRDAHAGDSGCVKAIFRVDPDLEVSLRHGIFVPGREYEGWIRFSNGDSKPGNSRWPDARGMAIKLLGVDGETMLPDQPGTQDFILISEPVFFCDDLQRYRLTLNEFLSDWKIVRWLSVRHLRGREILLAIKTNLLRFITNPLFHQYWSMTPYRLGAADAANKNGGQVHREAAASAEAHVLRSLVRNLASVRDLSDAGLFAKERDERYARAP
jgi:hypothetical protein